MPKLLVGLDGQKWSHYDDENFTELTGERDPQDAHPHIIVGGEKRYMAAMRSPFRMRSNAISFSASGLELYNESDFERIIKERNAAKAWPLNYCDFPCKDQNGKSSCWGSSPCQMAQCKSRMQGLPGDEWSTCSVTGPITGYRDVGGFGENANNYLQEHGAVSVKDWPNNAYDSRLFDKTYDLRKRRKVVQRVEIRTYQELFSAVAQGHPCHNDLSWWSHLYGCVAFATPVDAIGRNTWSDSYGTQITFERGTYGGFFTLSKSKALDLGSGNTYAIVAVTSYAGE